MQRKKMERHYINLTSFANSSNNLTLFENFQNELLHNDSLRFNLKMPKINSEFTDINVFRDLIDCRMW